MGSTSEGLILGTKMGHSCGLHIMNAQSLDTLFPIVFFWVKDGATVEELGSMFAVLETVKRRGKYVTLTDATLVREMPSATVRRFIADKQAESVEKYGESSIGAVVAVRSNIARGALTAINWIKPPKTQQVFVSTRLEGVKQCVAWLEGEKIAIPSALLAYQKDLELNADASFPGSKEFAGPR
jgi:hypothetical protein